MYDRYEEILKEKGYTNYRVSKETGISQATLSDWKKGKSVPKMDKLKKIAEFLDVSVTYLIGNEDKQEILTEKDKKDIAKRMEKIKEDLYENEGLSFFGEPITDEAKESLISALEYIVTQTKKTNKKFIPKKYRE